MVWLRANLPEDAVITNGAGISPLVNPYSDPPLAHNVARPRARWDTALRPDRDIGIKRLDPERTVSVRSRGERTAITDESQEYATAALVRSPDHSR